MNPEKFGLFIKKIRKDNHLTQKDLANKYHVTYQAVSKWENGKNMPDTLLIKQMSEDFNISLDDLYESKYSPKKRTREVYILSFTLIIISLIIGGVILKINANSNSDFLFKTIESNCQDFNITGSIAYNNSKSSIYISNIDYCGTPDPNIYSNITCSLYESNQVIDTYTYNDSPITLEDFLKKVEFTIESYSRVCKTYSKDTLYLEITAENNSSKTTTYKIPLKLDNNCEEN